jgi:hypothetical protein
MWLARACAGSMSPKVTPPASGRTKPARVRSRVVLPAPFAPVRATASPDAMWKDRSRNRTRSPRETVRESTEIIRAPSSCESLSMTPRSTWIHGRDPQPSLYPAPPQQAFAARVGDLCAPSSTARSACRFSLKVLLENLLRFEDGVSVTRSDIKAVADWQKQGQGRARDRLPPGPRADAGLHRRARRGRPGRHARRHGGARRRPEERSTR